jgi:hypothetical protein
METAGKGNLQLKHTNKKYKYKNRLESVKQVVGPISAQMLVDWRLGECGNKFMLCELSELEFSTSLIKVTAPFFTDRSLRSLRRRRIFRTKKNLGTMPQGSLLAPISYRATFPRHLEYFADHTSICRNAVFSASCNAASLQSRRCGQRRTNREIIVFLTTYN